MSFASRNLFALLACHPSDRAYVVCMAETNKVRIEFSVDNAAFEDDFEHELDLVLEQVRKNILAQQASSKPMSALFGCRVADSDSLRDSNGNTIGSVESLVESD